MCACVARVLRNNRVYDSSSSLTHPSTDADVIDSDVRIERVSPGHPERQLVLRKSAC